MGLHRYTSIQQAKEIPGDALDAAAPLDRMLELVSLAAANRPPLFEPGVYQFRSLAEANQAREVATIRRMRVLRGVGRR